jgi:hypothetical protein
MTWTAFFHAIRKGTVDRVATMTRRGGNTAQQTSSGSKSSATQAQAPKKVAKRPMEEWDILIVDVSGIYGMPFDTAGTIQI